MKANRWGGVTGALLVFGFLGLLAFGLTRDPRIIPSPVVGRVAPPFALEGLTGDTVRLADYAGTVVVVNYWASWCLACEDEHPVLEYVNQKYRPLGVRLLGIVYQDSRKNALRWLNLHGGVHWPHALDHKSRTAIEYGVRGVPETFFIDRDGRLAYQHIGPVTWALVDDLLPRLLEERAGPVGPGRDGN